MSKEYIKAQTPLPAYFPYPKFLLQMSLSHTARLTYVLLLDRMTLSQKNGWVDVQGRAYVLYPLARLAKDLQSSISSITRALRELEAARLIERRSNGFSKPNQIFLGVPQTVQKCAIEMVKNEQPDCSKVSNTIAQNCTPNQINKNNLKWNKINRTKEAYGRYRNVFLENYSELKIEIAELDALIEDLSAYMQSIAGALGFSAEDTAEAIGLMANSGIKASQAGTSLRSIMNNLAGEVTFVGKNIGEVTIATSNADGSMRSLNDILADCRVAFSGLSESEKAANAEALVGKNAMSGFLALMNSSETDINKLRGAIENCDGASESMAETMQDNLNGQLTILKSQLEELAISFGDILMPTIRKIVSAVQQFVDKLNSMDESMYIPFFDSVISLFLKS